MPKSNFEFNRIVVELFKILKNRLPAVDYSGESKIEPETTHFLTLLTFSCLAVLYVLAWLIFCFKIPFKAGEVLQNL
jgi:hypothetical protein